MCVVVFYYMFNPSKCKKWYFGKEMLCHKSVVFKLRNDILDRSEREVLSGTVLASSKKQVIKCKRKLIMSFKNMLHSTQSIGSRMVPVTSITAS